MTSIDHLDDHENDHKTVKSLEKLLAISYKLWHELQHCEMSQCNKVTMQ